MKRASYKEAIEYVALNDSPGDSDALNWESVQGLVTVQLIAAIFDILSEKVAKDVVKCRIKSIGGYYE